MKTSTKILIGVASLFAVAWGGKEIGGSDDGINHDIFTEVDCVEYRVMNDEAMVMGLNRALKGVTEVHIRPEIEYKGRMLKVTSINESAFKDCEEIKTVYVPNSVTEIGKKAFACCDNLNSVELPDSLSSINDSLFSSCTKLAYVKIPKGVTSIGNNAFEFCWGLSAVTVPEGVTTIGVKAFNGCKGVMLFILPESLRSIGDEAFSGCWHLTSLEIPEGVTSIGGNAFTDWERLTSITIPEGLMTNENFSFYNCLYDFDSSSKHDIQNDKYLATSCLDRYAEEACLCPLNNREG